MRALDERRFHAGLAAADHDGVERIPHVVSR
jgi:hypothetical protein